MHPSTLPTVPTLPTLPSIPPSIPSLLTTDLILLHRLQQRNAAQHRSGLFFRRVDEVKKLGCGVLGLVLEIREGRGGAREVGRLKVFIKRSLPALTRATLSVNQMISQLHFLPFTTTLLAIYARIWMLWLDIKSCLLAWDEIRSESMKGSNLMDGVGVGDGNGKGGVGVNQNENEIIISRKSITRKRDLTESEIIQAGTTTSLISSSSSSQSNSRQRITLNPPEKKSRKGKKRKMDEVLDGVVVVVDDGGGGDGGGGDGFVKGGFDLGTNIPRSIVDDGCAAGGGGGGGGGLKRIIKESKDQVENMKTAEEGVEVEDDGLRIPTNLPSFLSPNESIITTSVIENKKSIKDDEIRYVKKQKKQEKKKQKGKKEEKEEENADDGIDSNLHKPQKSKNQQQQQQQQQQDILPLLKPQPEPELEPELEFKSSLPSSSSSSSSSTSSLSLLKSQNVKNDIRRLKIQSFLDPGAGSSTADPTTTTTKTTTTTMTASSPPTPTTNDPKSTRTDNTDKSKKSKSTSKSKPNSKPKSKSKSKSLMDDIFGGF